MPKKLDGTITWGSVSGDTVSIRFMAMDDATVEVSVRSVTGMASAIETRTRATVGSAGILVVGASVVSTVGIVVEISDSNAALGDAVSVLVAVTIEVVVNGGSVISSYCAADKVVILRMVVAVPWSPYQSFHGHSHHEQAWTTVGIKSRSKTQWEPCIVFVRAVTALLGLHRRQQGPNTEKTIGSLKAELNAASENSQMPQVRWAKAAQ